MILTKRPMANISLLGLVLYYLIGRRKLAG
ncbi:hypothetical protein SAMN05421739_104474 [Pontibacter chinhatensis]|uniref:Uncharacterized protein n=1 Tax=Pontibacter chinhatensis TaxID=1436961 RepID=A0A1I2W1D1_9BACT|nr:hypothetical protein SAMN05421739_104474 [Pontibacter chinhatensis]